MNPIDVALAFLLLLCALRGYWRGFFRECFGLLALITGIIAAVRLTAPGAALLQQYARLPAPVQTGLSFVVIFVVVHTVVNLVGVLLDRLAAALFLRGINRVAGAALGTAKAAVVLSFVLLLLHLFPVVPSLDGHIMTSTLGRPLVTAAGNVVRLGLQTAARPEAASKT
jgi:membrane protein required for colicin V production